MLHTQFGSVFLLERDPLLAITLVYITIGIRKCLPQLSLIKTNTSKRKAVNIFLYQTQPVTSKQWIALSLFSTQPEHIRTHLYESFPGHCTVKYA